MKKMLSLIISVAMLTAIVAGCSNENTNETTAATEATTTATEATEATEADATEAEETTEAVETEAAAPSKVVSISPTLTEIVFALGKGDVLVGRTDYDDYPADVFAIESIGDLYTPDIEKIVSLEPDLVLASSIFTEESKTALEDLGINVVVIVDEESFEGTYDVVSAVAEALWCPEAGEALNADIKARYEAAYVEAGDDAPTVYYCMGFGEWGEFTAGGDTFINDIIESAGAKNAAGDVEGWSFSVEALVEADPDIILLSTWCDYDTFTTSEPYSELSAVKNGQVYSVDGNLFERQGPRNVEGMELISSIVAEMNGEAADAA